MFLKHVTSYYVIILLKSDHTGQTTEVYFSHSINSNNNNIPKDLSDNTMGRLLALLQLKWF